MSDIEREDGVNISGADVKIRGAVTQIDKINEGRPTTIINRSGGTDINASGGTVNISGDVVGRDRINTSTSTGIDSATLVELIRHFNEINRKIDLRPESPDVDKQELKDTVVKIQDEVKKGEGANSPKVERWLRFLGDMAGDILDVTTSTLANPTLGVSRAIQLIAQKLREQKAIDQ